MTDDCLKLTVWFGESDRVRGRLLSDALVDCFARHELHAAVLMRAVEGFGLGQTIRTDRFLSLSEDLPLVAVAVDERARVEAALPEVTALVDGGLVTLERTRLLHDGLGAVELPEDLHEATKLTLYLGRDERVGRVPAFAAVVDELHRHGLAGATVLLGVDGMAHRQRRRARFFARNESVPVQITTVGAGAAVAAVLPRLGGLLDDPIATLERVRVCKRDGAFLAEPHRLPDRDEQGLALWQKLTVYAGEQSRHAGRPLAPQLVRRLREEGASGATTLRGVWGFSGDHAPHGDRLGRLRRRVPVVTTLVDTPPAMRRWFALVDECTDEGGLVTSEVVPALRATAGDRSVGDLRRAAVRRGSSRAA